MLVLKNISNENKDSTVGSGNNIDNRNPNQKELKYTVIAQNKHQKLIWMKVQNWRRWWSNRTEKGKTKKLMRRIRRKENSCRNTKISTTTKEVFRKDKYNNIIVMRIISKKLLFFFQ